MSVLGNLWQAATLAFLLAAAIGLVDLAIHRGAHAITITCPNCGGEPGDWCEECHGAGIVDEDGETDRAYDRSVDYRHGVA